MASVTIRQIDELTKQKLRERAARNGVSMEQELRSILQALAEEDLVASPPVSTSAAAGSSLELAATGPLDAPDSAGSLSGRRILLIIGGGIAAYKCLDLVRRLRERGASVRTVMSKAAQSFVTPMSVSALTADRVFTDLFDRDDEHDIGHIRLSREADLLVVAPATADLLAKMANGLANDLASTVLMATDKQVLVAPAMNPRMWMHPATRRNVAALRKDGISFIGPNRGEMAESGEAGEGRMSEPLEIAAAVETMLDNAPKPLRGKKIIMTSGPTHEPIDPVRYIANRSSGKQGHAIAGALARLGANVQLVSGPVNIPDPAGVSVTKVESARQMRDAVESLLPADAAIMVAAVADWRTDTAADEKIKKAPGSAIPVLQLTENPDILAGIGNHERRPDLVIGFAAETSDLIENASTKLKRKGADFIVANDVSQDSGIGETGVMGGDRNRVRIVSQSGVDAWPEMTKTQVAEKLAGLVAERLTGSR
ncbi:MAG: bifunctional phosphopantothenoylcysteine decarboxylase/phosphopantothenate--cysteine ligase CoaBC [Rhizobiaceae bacterium]